MPYSFSCEAEGPRRNGAQLLELGKGGHGQRQILLVHVAMEPSF